MNLTTISIVVGALGTVPRGLEKENTEGMENQRKNRNYLDHSIVEIGQNTEKSLV